MIYAMLLKDWRQNPNMANFIKRPGTKTQKHGGIMAYAKNDRFTDIICSACKKNQLPLQYQ